MSMQCSQFVPPSSSLPVSTNQFSMSVSLFMPWTKFQQYHFSRFHIYVFLLFSHYVQLFAIPWTAACQASLSFTISQSLFKLMSIASMMPSNYLINVWYLVFPFLTYFHSVLQTLGSSTSLQMAQFHSFLWLIFHSIYVPHLLYPFVCRRTSKLLPCPSYYK